MQRKRNTDQTPRAIPGLMSKGAALTLDVGCALDVANCTITILVAVLVAIVVAASYSLPSVFVTVLVLCTLADALKARQTEYYTNTRLRRPSTVPCHPVHFPQLPCALSPLCSAVPVSFHSMAPLPRRRRRLGLRMFHLRKDGKRKRRGSEGYTPPRDFGQEFGQL